MPILHRGEPVGLLQIANKETDYTEEDVALLERICALVGPVLDARLTRQRLEEARRRAEQSLREAVTELERSNRELEQFAYVASHDLQEPLRMVSSYTKLLERRYRDQLDGDALEFIEYAVDGAERMQRLIQDMLAYSRVTTKGRPLAQLDAHEAFGEAVANLKTAIEEAGALVSTADLPRVRGDHTQVVQLFQNLIGNGIKFRRPDVTPHIHVSVSRTPDEEGLWTFQVDDNGIGIDPKYADRVFVIFQRLHGRGDYPGTGIGLALCKRIVERHGGAIWLAPKNGPGTSIGFKLAAAPDDT